MWSQRAGVLSMMTMTMVDDDDDEDDDLIFNDLYGC